MNTISKKIQLFALWSATLMVSLLTSCLNDSNEDMTLSGDISKYVPDYSVWVDFVAISSRENGTYLMCAPEMKADFAMWGLYIKKIEYYIDGEMLGISTSAPFTFTTHVDAYMTGSMLGRALVTVGGENCEDYTFAREEKVILNSANNRPIDIFMDYNYVKSGDIFRFEPVIIEEFSSPAATISNVHCIFGKEDQIITATPFVFSHVVSEPDGSSIPFTATVNYRDPNSSMSSYSYSFSTSIRVGGDMCRYDAGLMTENSFYTADQHLPLYAKLYPGKGYIDSEFKVIFELDEKEISSVSNFPYMSDYPLSRLEKGVHSLKTTFVSHKEGSGQQTQTQTKYFVIID